jgi:hypothetical protein
MVAHPDSDASAGNHLDPAGRVLHHVGQLLRRREREQWDADRTLADFEMGEGQEPQPDSGVLCVPDRSHLSVPEGVLGGRRERQIRRPGEHAGRTLDRQPLGNRADAIRTFINNKIARLVQGSLSLRNHLAVRDILRRDPDLREQYAAVKRQAGAIAANIDEYGRAKSAMVQRILAVAGLTDAERAAIGANQVPAPPPLA